MLVTHHRGGPIAEGGLMYLFAALISAGGAGSATYKAVELQQTAGGESPALAFGLAVCFGLTSIYFMMMEIRDTLRK